jgi:hypothetical protein
VVQSGVAHRARRVLEQHLLLLRRQLPEQVAGPLQQVDPGDDAASMNEVVDGVLKRCALMQTMDEARVAESREKISRYIEKLAAAGQKDTHQLTRYGLAYLKELHEGRDPRFTGC